MNVPDVHLFLFFFKIITIYYYYYFPFSLATTIALDDNNDLRRDHTNVNIHGKVTNGPRDVNVSLALLNVSFLPFFFGFLIVC